MERIIFPGGSSWQEGLGPKCAVLATDEWNLMLDCGTEFIPWPKGTDDLTRKLYRRCTVGPNLRILEKVGVKSIDALILSHSHLDHAAATPLLERYFTNGAKIYGSPHTAAIIKKGFYDTLRFSPYFYREIMGPLGVDDCLQRRGIMQVGVNTIPPGIEFRIGEAGHIPGAAYIIVKLPSGKKVLDTGDICFHNQPVVLGSLIPDDLPDEWLPDSIIGTDLTNPSLREFSWEEESERLNGRVKVALGEGKTIIIGAFENSRGQNIAIELARAGLSPYIDGGIRQIFDIFREYAAWSPRCVPMSIENICKVKSEEHRQELMQNGIPKVIVTTSGMGDGGPIESYFEYGLSRDDFLFLSSSYLAPGSKLARLLGASKRGAAEVNIGDEEDKKVKIPLRAKIEDFHFTAHGNLRDLVALAAKLVLRRGKILDEIFIAHGTYEAKRAAAELLAPFAKSVIFGNIGTVYELS